MLPLPRLSRKRGVGGIRLETGIRGSLGDDVGNIGGSGSDVGDDGGARSIPNAACVRVG